MERLKQGEEEAFRCLMERHEARVFAFFYRRSEDAGLAEDLTLEVWHKIYQARQTYRPQARFTTFLYRVVKNHWIDHIRVHANRPRKTLSLEHAVGSAAADEGTSLGELLQAGGAAPEARQVGRELAAKIREALECLNAGEQRVFEMAVYDELKYADIGAILEIPVGTVKSRMHTSMRKLRAWLEKEGLRP
ncbi:MAG: sigma-70 family RNA polymerase sigma factor [Planctomycetes bacterium]|nr:sigma-70 family RNA polymerase sigma factor [Planctomycetota bacterium]